MKNEGKYIEGDYVVSLKKEQQFLLEYNHKIKNMKAFERNIFHVDIPFSNKTQSQLLLKGGFSKVKVIFHQNEAAIFIARVCNFGLAQLIKVSEIGGNAIIIEQPSLSYIETMDWVRIWSSNYLFNCLA